jgi:hypothetical protein
VRVFYQLRLSLVDSVVSLDFTDLVAGVRHQAVSMETVRMGPLPPVWAGKVWLAQQEKQGTHQFPCGEATVMSGNRSVAPVIEWSLSEAKSYQSTQVGYLSASKDCMRAFTGPPRATLLHVGSNVASCALSRENYLEWVIHLLLTAEGRWVVPSGNFLGPAIGL